MMKNPKLITSQSMLKRSYKSNPLKNKIAGGKLGQVNGSCIHMNSAHNRQKVLPYSLRPKSS